MENENPSVMNLLARLILLQTFVMYVQDDTKKRELLKNPTKIEGIPR